MLVKPIKSISASPSIEAILKANKCDQCRKTKWEVFLVQEVWGIRVVYVASSNPKSIWIEQQRRCAGFCHWNVQRRGRLQEWFESAVQWYHQGQGRSSFCPSLCHPSISFIPKPAFLLVMGWLPATAGASGIHVPFE